MAASTSETTWPTTGRYTTMRDSTGLFIPYDLLRRRCGEPMELTEAEELLDTVGLQALGEQWLLRAEGDAWVPVGIQEFSRESVTVAPQLDDRAVAKALDLTATVMLSLPTDRLRSAE